MIVGLDSTSGWSFVEILKSRMLGQNRLFIIVNYIQVGENASVIDMPAEHSSRSSTEL